MSSRKILRAAVLGLSLALASAGVVLADRVGRDADVLLDGIQGSRHLGDVGPGQILDVQIAFLLTCANAQHVDPGQALLIALGAAIVPEGGAVSMEATTLGPTPGSWPADEDACAANAPIGATGTVRITAPATLGLHEYSFLFDRTPTPAGSNDGGAVSGSTAATFTLTVVANTPPVIVLPDHMTVEAEPSGEWMAAYVVSVSDAEDEPDPVATCLPALGSPLPVGTTTVECSVSDAGGLQANGAFDITVVARPVGGDPEPSRVAIFDRPIGEDGLDGHAGRTIPMVVRLVGEPASDGDGVLRLVGSPCDGGTPTTEVVMEWRPGAGAWFGLLRTHDFAAGCYAVRAALDGIDVGGTEMRLLGTPAAKNGSSTSRGPVARR